MGDAGSLATHVERVSSQAFIFIPLPWRVILLTGSGILCWATNIHFLHLVGIDAAYILDVQPPTNLYSAHPLAVSHSHNVSSNSARLYHAIYKLFATYASWSFGCWLVFRALCGTNANTIDEYKVVLDVCAVGLLAALICPFNVLSRRERDLFLHAGYRCLFSPINQSVYFSDVVLADIFTSFAKVIGDLWISACMLVPWGSLRVLPLDQGWIQWIVPGLMSLPYFVRLRQCLAEYLSSPQRSDKRALFNAVKYATAFPVIFLSAAQRHMVSELVADKGPQAARSSWHGEHQLFRLWLLTVVVNSIYSFWWDVTNDWGLSLLQPSRSKSEGRSISPRRSSPSPMFHKHRASGSTLPILQSDDEYQSVPGPSTPPSYHLSKPGFPRGLRPTLLFHEPIIYYIAIALNFILRLTWSLKLSSHLHTVADLEVGIFMMEALELIRRWVWVFFRIEWEAVKRASVGESGGLRLTEVHELESEFRRRSAGDG